MKLEEKLLIALVALAPFIGFELRLPVFQDPTLSRIFGGGINLPWSDVIGLVLLVVAARKFRRIPSWLWMMFGLFVLSGLLSVMNAPDALRSLKYVIYPIALTILIYGFLPALVVESDRTMARVLWTVYGVGIFFAVVGLASVFLFPTIGGFPVARPIGIGNFFPLGTNHNSLAQTLIVAIPIGFALAAGRKWIRAGSWLMVAVAILTFSRMAFIVLGLMGIGYVWIPAFAGMTNFAGMTKGKMMKKILVGLALAAPLVVALAIFSAGPGGRGSVAARTAMTDASLLIWSRNPVFGAGAGSWFERLAREPIYVEFFGAPVEAHGFPQKFLAEQGIMGILTFGMLLIGMLKFKPKDAMSRALMFAAIGMVIYELSDTSYYTAKLWLPMGLAFAYAHRSGFTDAFDRRRRAHGRRARG